MVTLTAARLASDDQTRRRRIEARKTVTDAAFCFQETEARAEQFPHNRLLGYFEMHSVFLSDVVQLFECKVLWRRSGRASHLSKKRFKSRWRYDPKKQ
jgi:hypothetical protein